MTRSMVTRTVNTADLSPSPGYGAHAWPFLSSAKNRKFSTKSYMYAKS